MTLGKLLKKASEYLFERNVEDPSLEAGLLLSWLLKKDVGYIYANPEIVLDDEKEKEYLSIVERRGRHEPYAYITGECGFLDYTFYVDPNVLIPRGDTELLAQSALYALGQQPAFFNQDMFRLNKKKQYKVLDIGTGSGCLAVSIAKGHASAFVDAGYLGKCFRYCPKNAERYGVQENKFY